MTIAALLLMCATNTSTAQDVPDFYQENTNGDTLYYKIIGDNVVKVFYTSEDFDQYARLTGTLVIPSTVTNQGTTYTVTTIGNFGGTNYSAVDFPNTITHLEQDCFAQCTTLTAIALPNSVFEIGQYAFYGCTALATVTLPNSVWVIGNGAFGGDTALRAVTLPDSTSLVGDAPFAGCTGLTQPLYNSTHLMFFPQDYSGEYTIPDGIHTVCGGVFTLCEGLTAIHFPSSIELVGRDCFYGCTGLTSVVLPQNLGVVSENLFWGCTSLQSVNITSSVLTKIGACAFTGCSSLTSVTLPNSNYEYSIYSSAFSGCNLQSIVIPASVSLLGNEVFYGNNALTSIIMKGSTPPTIEDGTFVLNEDGDGTTYLDPVVTVPCGAEPTYRANEFWNRFTTIEEDCNSIEDLNALDAKIYSNSGQIVVEGAEQNMVTLIDINGRILVTKQGCGTPLRFDVLASGTYLVKVGNHPAHRVVVVR